MGSHNIQSKLENPRAFDSTYSGVTTPEGKIQGAGTTKGNGVEGWAPGAIFIDTDASQGAQVFVNTGTKTTATWTEISDAGTEAGFNVTSGTVDLNGANLEINDTDELRFGDLSGGDITVQWDGSNLTSGPASGMWTGCPSPIDPSPYKYYEFFDDFIYENALDANLRWLEIDDAGTGTNLLNDVAGGTMSLVTAASNDDYHAIQSRSQVFNLLNTKELWFEARFRLTEANTDDSAWWFGLSDTLTTGGFTTAATGPLASYDGCLVWKDEGTMLVDFETSNATTQATTTNMATFVSGNWTRVAFHASAAATTAVVTPYFDIDDSGVLTAGTAQNLTRSGLLEMNVIMGVKTGTGVETLEIDYVKIIQLR